MMITDSPEKTTTGNHLETLDYLRNVESATCLLLPTSTTPSPMDFKHPLSDQMSEGPLLMLNGQAELQNMADSSGGDSSSSADSNSAIHDPVSAQLINNISMLDYQTLTKNGDLLVGEVDDVKMNGTVTLGGRKLPGFVNWNWPLIRKFLLWVVLSGLVSCIAAIIAMVVMMPRTCNFELPWYQSKVFYEIFPASFKDSNNDGTGDLKGIIQELDYIKNLGVSAIRLNNIFEADNYPEHYKNVKTLLKIDSSVGTLQDFKILVSAVHAKNMSLVLDLPVKSMASPNTSPNINSSQTVLLGNDSLVSYHDETSAAVAFWSQAQNVDGFYLKDLEKFVDDAHFGKTLQLWKRIIGADKILMVSEQASIAAKGDALNVLLNRVDLIDVHLDLSKGIDELKSRIKDVLYGNLWAKAHYPWVHWNIGNIDSGRVTSANSNSTLALTALEFILPGTVNIFYGDEIGLGNVDAHEVEHDFHEHEQIKNLVPMTFSNRKEIENTVLHWASKSSLEPRYQFIETIKNFAKVHESTPTINVRAILKDGYVLKNTAIRETEHNLIVVERWYPRKHTCVFIGNLGSTPITTDLSTMFYGGAVIASTNSSLVGQTVYLDDITFAPYSAMILKLEK